MTKMADGVDIDLYADDLEQDFAQVTANARDWTYGDLVAAGGASRTAMMFGMPGCTRRRVVCGINVFRLLIFRDLRVAVGKERLLMVGFACFRSKQALTGCGPL